MALVALPPVSKTKPKPKAIQPFNRSVRSASHELPVADHGSSGHEDRSISIGAIDDEHEREADAVASAVMSGTALHTTLRSSGAKVQRACAKCSEDEELRMKANVSGASTSPGQTSRSMTAQINGLRRAGGLPLPAATGRFMEQRFDRDLSRVRVHTSAKADQLSQALNAKAFTVGNDIFFGRNQFQPQHRGGQRLIAHEITHTLQQAQTASAGRALRSPPTIQRASLDGRPADVEPSEPASETADAKSCQTSMPDPLEWQADSTLAAVRTDKPGAGRHLLASGSTGPSVVRVQQALQAWGCERGLELLPEFGADGQFGAETKAAIKEFQRAHGGGVDGVIGPLTMYQLDMLVVGAPLTGGGGIVVDDDFDGEMGDARRMRKSEFIAAIRAEACALAQNMLANTAYSFEDCSALFAFLEFLDTMGAGEIEQAIVAGAPAGARALSARQLIDAVLQQVRSSISAFLGGGQDIVAILTDLGAPDFVIERAEQEMASDGQTQKKESGSGGGATLDAGRVQHQLRGRGRPLETGVRSRMESAMASDFGGVRIHTGPQAAGLASSMHARAFTVGSDVGFAPGEYRPGNLIGDALLAHELAHVQQQGGERQEAPGDAGSSQLEDAADESALAAMLRIGGGALSRFAQSIGAVGAKAMPRLRSGLRLSRCSGDPAKVDKFTTRIGKVEVTIRDGKCAMGLISTGMGADLKARLDTAANTKQGEASFVQKVNSCRQAYYPPEKKYYHLELQGLDKDDPYPYAPSGTSLRTSATIQPSTQDTLIGMEDFPAQRFAFNHPTLGAQPVDQIEVDDTFTAFVTWKSKSLSRSTIGKVGWYWKGSAQKGPACGSSALISSDAKIGTEYKDLAEPYPPSGSSMKTPIDPSLPWKEGKCSPRPSVP